MEALYVFSDASVRGEWCVDTSGREVRAQEGMAMGAWVGWMGRDTECCPVIAGTTFLGSREGPNKAEYRALIAGVAESLGFVESHEVSSRPEAVILHTDNKQVAWTLTGRYNAEKLIELRSSAREIQGKFESLGIEVHYELVGGSVAGLKCAHEMSKRAFDQLLTPAWRPVGRATKRPRPARNFPSGRARAIGSGLRSADPGRLTAVPSGP
jgi:ribonuclease HI